MPSPRRRDNINGTGSPLPGRQALARATALALNQLGAREAPIVGCGVTRPMQVSDRFAPVDSLTSRLVDACERKPRAIPAERAEAPSGPSKWPADQDTRATLECPLTYCESSRPQRWACANSLREDHVVHEPSLLEGPCWRFIARIATPVMVSKE